MTLALTLLAVGIVVYHSLVVVGGPGTPLPKGLIKNAVLPIFLPVLAEMVAFFFVQDDAQINAARRRRPEKAQVRVALLTAALYGLMPSLILLLGPKGEMQDNLATFQLVAQPIFASVIVYYFGRRPNVAGVVTDP